jgi:hypothetical protein
MLRPLPTRACPCCGAAHTNTLDAPSFPRNREPAHALFRGRDLGKGWVTVFAGMAAVEEEMSCPGLAERFGVAPSTVILRHDLSRPAGTGLRKSAIERH